MKKHLILFFLVGTLALTSCSNEDDAVNNNNDPILGTWILVDVNQPEIFNVEACSQSSTLTLHEDYSASSTYYIPVDDCQPQNSEGTWSTEGESNYKITVPVLGSVEGTVTFEGSDKFIFQKSDVQLTFEKQ